MKPTARRCAPRGGAPSGCAPATPGHAWLPGSRALFFARMSRLAVATSLGLLVGCNNPGGSSTGFTTPGVTTRPADTSSGESTSTGDGSSSTSSTSTGSGSADASTGSSTTGAVFPDMGVMPDFGGPPMGCKGKIDFLFVISRDGVMGPVQDKLVAAAPAFLATIQAQFDDFDLHIMVVDSEPQWWVGSCEDQCPAPCKNAPGYPCGAVPSACDTTVGAGTVYNVGPYATERPLRTRRTPLHHQGHPRHPVGLRVHRPRRRLGQ
jgi:hypothetical protein